MYKRLSKEEKEQIIKRVLNGEKVASICREVGISREIFYQWLKAYKASMSIQPTLRVQRRRGYPAEVRRKVIHYSLEHPSSSIAALATQLGLSEGYVWEVLRSRQLQTETLRQQHIAQMGERILAPISASEKLVLMRRFEQGESVAQLCREFGISRTTFYIWYKRYAVSHEELKQQALTSRRPSNIKHWRYFAQAREIIAKLVSQHPEFTAKQLSDLFQIEAKASLSASGVYLILKELDLTTYEKRLAYAEEQKKDSAGEYSLLDSDLPETAAYSFNSSLSPPSSLFSSVTFFVVVALCTFLFAFGVLLVGSIFAHADSLYTAIGLFFALVSLAFGMFFFVYSLKYFVSTAIVLSHSRTEGDKRGIGSWMERLFGFSISIDTQGEDSTKHGTRFQTGKGIGLQANLADVVLERHPFVSIHISTYNEKRVIDRLLTAATSMDYDQYEVIIADDSTDETVALLEKWRAHPKVKISHRDSRDGYKGQALAKALTQVDPRTEFIMIFDADFIPYPDSITQFLKYFQVAGGGLGSRASQSLPHSHIAAVQGYQWHVLNKSENWVTRGVRSEYAGSYVIERSGTEVYGGLKQISGSVYMVRRSVVEEVGWGRSITEDFEFTLRIYEKGYKVVYTPYIQAPAEAVSTIKRLIRQRMRWAEGHSFNIKRMFWRLLLGRWESGKKVFVASPLSWNEKFELIYLAPYYLQAAFFMAGTFSWFMAELVFGVRLPFWTEAWGWSLVFTNLLALPLMNLVGLFMEESEEKDYIGLLAFVALSYIVAPFQAYAAVKGFVEKKEGPWFRTPKTGRITDTFLPGKIYRFVRGIFGKPSYSMSAASSEALSVETNPYVALATAHNRFGSFSVHLPARKRVKWVARTAVVFCLIISLLALSLEPLSLLGKGNSDLSKRVIEKGLRLFSPKQTFAFSEKPSFTLEIDPGVVGSLSSEQSGLGIFNARKAYAADDMVQTKLYYYSQLVSTKTSVRQTGEKTFAVAVERPRQFTPGKYTLETNITKDDKVYQTRQDFSWGVLAMNTSKSVYSPGETIHFHFGVLDDLGETLCDARLELSIIVPSEHDKAYYLSSQNGKIRRSSSCSKDSVTNTADYQAEFVAKQVEEEYQLRLVADTENGRKVIDDSLAIRKADFVVERSSYPTRIYPKASYPVRLSVTPLRSFAGVVSDEVPADLRVTDIADGGQVKKAGEINRIIWRGSWEKGKTYTFTYRLHFPLISPQFYSLGPVKLYEQTAEERGISWSTLFSSEIAGKVLFREARSWQIASDAVSGDGIIIYGVSGNTTPQFRSYTNSSNAFGTETNTVSGATGVSFVLRTSPTALEAVAGYVTSGGVLHVLCYDGSAWTDDWTVTVGGTGTTRPFDIAYETNSGDVMVLYSGNVASSTNELGYRTKTTAGCGSAKWSGANNLSPARTSGTVGWVKMAWDKRSSSNLITALWSDSNRDLSAMVWSGSAWGNEPSSALETNLEILSTAQDVDDFDVVYESSSGDVLAAWSKDNTTSTGAKYVACTGGTSSCTWGASANVSTASNGATNCVLAANPNSDEVVYGANDSHGGARVDASYWNGSTWSGVTHYDTSTAAVVAGTKLIAAGWLISGATTRSVVVYNDSASTNIGWIVGNTSTFTVQTDASVSPAFGDPQKWYSIDVDPLNQDRLMFTVSDTNSDLFAKRLVMTSTPTFTWSDSDGGAALEATLAQATVSDFSFAYWRNTTPLPEEWWLLLILAPALWFGISYLKKRQVGAAVVTYER
jgi:cellulose synthase/poly-beta-1,6-N-acetylglucosamine synthase-like glycosyltransferase/transposase-like protein